MRHPSSTYAYCRARTESDFVVHRVTKAPAFPTFVILRVLARLVAEALITNPASAALRLRALLVDAPPAPTARSRFRAMFVPRHTLPSRCRENGMHRIVYPTRQKSDVAVVVPGVQTVGV